jgi:hypothetical protein
MFFTTIVAQLVTKVPNLVLFIMTAIDTDSAISGKAMKE